MAFKALRRHMIPAMVIDVNRDEAKTPRDQ
jgi:hypothetical protein